jgi:hypothetical protein
VEKEHGFFGARRQLEHENAELRRVLASFGLAERDRLAAEMQQLRTENARLHAEYTELSRLVIETREEAILQEVGVYRYRHPLQDAAAYKSRLSTLQDQIRAAAKSGNAVQGSTAWTLNGSAKEGARMMRDYGKLMLRAYNNEADNAVRSMKPYTLASAVQRLEKTRQTIQKLTAAMGIHIVEQYHRMRILELELTADYEAKVAEEKERERETRARLREEEVARREFEREQERLGKELRQYQSALAALRARGDTAAASETASKLAEIQSALDGVNRRAANVRAGCVYVISNIGAFGDRMVKVGMTRRLDPMDRVRELGDASVPFRFDVHALIFSDDAVGLETRLHQALGSRRVNMVNAQREFFYATVLEVKELLQQFQGSLLTYTDEAEAIEYRQSEVARRSAAAPST